jgi:hypothetical protein
VISAADQEIHPTATQPGERDRLDPATHARVTGRDWIGPKLDGTTKTGPNLVGIRLLLQFVLGEVSEADSDSAVSLL